MRDLNFECVFFKSQDCHGLGNNSDPYLLFNLFAHVLTIIYYPFYRKHFL